MCFSGSERGEDILLWRCWRQTHWRREHCRRLPGRRHPHPCSQLRGSAEPLQEVPQLQDRLWRTIHFGTCRTRPARDGITASALNALNEHPSYLGHRIVTQQFCSWPDPPSLPYRAPVSLPFYLPHKPTHTHKGKGPFYLWLVLCEGLPNWLRW